EESLGEDASKQGRIKAIDADEDITLLNDQDDADMFDVNDLSGEEVFVAEQEVVKENVVEEVVNAAQDSTAATTITTEELTLAQALKALKTSKAKVKEQEESGEPVKHKKKDQIRLDEEAAERLQAEFNEEERLTREKTQKEQEANIDLIETWDDIQAKINDDYQLAKRLKHFAAKEKRNKPPTQAQKKKTMCTYLKSMEGYTLKQLKSLEFDKIQEMFDRAFKRVYTFEPIKSKLVEKKEKRAGEEMIQEKIKKQKVEDDKETTKLNQLMEIILDKE
nr:hypothetical protein [Tanacetum cinerariifolium]